MVENTEDRKPTRRTFIAGGAAAVGLGAAASAARPGRASAARQRLIAPPDATVPSLPATSLGDTTVAEEAVLNALAGTLDVGIPYPLPTSNSMPSQATTPDRPPVP